MCQSLKIQLKKLNYLKSVKLRARVLEDGAISLYLDLWRNGKREYKYLKIYLTGNKKFTDSDKEKLVLASKIRDKKEMNLMEERNGFSLSDWKKETDFLPYFKSISKKKNSSTYQSCIFHLGNFNPTAKLPFRDIDFKLCQQFYNYLLGVVTVNSAKLYFTVFKSVLNTAVKEDILKKNPASKVVLTTTETKREFLSIEELKALDNTLVENMQIKNAFLFSCFTGLRSVDIKALQYKNIQSGYLVFKQVKTKGEERIKLSESALGILKNQVKLFGNTGVIFKLPSVSAISRHLKVWCEMAGIDKYITFHSARHTFATMCLTYDVDIFTVSKLLGHKDLKTTQIYAKLIDKKKDEAVNKLPSL